MDRYTFDELHALKLRVAALEQEVSALRAQMEPARVVDEHDTQAFNHPWAEEWDDPKMDAYNVYITNDAFGEKVISITDDEEP